MVTVPESVTQGGMQTAFGGPRTDSNAASIASPRKRHIGVWLFAGWAVLSVAWAGFMLMDLYNRVADQADMSREVEQELDSGLCSGAPCEAALHETPQEDWSNIAETYLQFGYVPLLEWTILPPALLLAAGLGGAIMMRRRRMAARA